MKENLKNGQCRTELIIKSCREVSSWVFTFKYIYILPTKYLCQEWYSMCQIMSYLKYIIMMNMF